MVSLGSVKGGSSGQASGDRVGFSWVSAGFWVGFGWVQGGFRVGLGWVPCEVCWRFRVGAGGPTLNLERTSHGT